LIRSADPDPIEGCGHRLIAPKDHWVVSRKELYLVITCLNEKNPGEGFIKIHQFDCGLEHHRDVTRFLDIDIEISTLNGFDQLFQMFLCCLNASFLKGTFKEMRLIGH